MKNYQKYLKKIAMMESEVFERSRFSIILLLALVFGVILQQAVFGSPSYGSEGYSEIIETPSKKTASVVSALSKNNSNFVKSENIDSTKNKESELTLTSEEFGKTDRNAFSEEDEVLRFEGNPDFLPIRNFDKENLSLDVKSAIAIYAKDGRILYEKNINDKLPIASLTKVVSAMVVLENIDDEEVITISENAIKTEGVSGRFVVGEKIKSIDLLKIMLTISSNDAAVAFSEYFESKGMNMIDLMNKKALELGAKNTNFTNSVGFDNENHYSTSYDYSKIILHSLSNKKLWSILSIKDQEVFDFSGNNKRRLISSNKLMFDKDVFGILGGKTGYTENAGGALMTAFQVYGESGREDGIVIGVILGAKDTEARFIEMKKLINWVREAYIF